MLDVKDEFTRFCGPSVLFVERHTTHGRTLKIVYTIPAIDTDERRFVIAHLRNGLESVLRQAVRRCAKQAFDDAYVRTGQRAGDMRQLMSGRIHG